jgi:hypothetical protein
MGVVIVFLAVPLLAVSVIAVAAEWVLELFAPPAGTDTTLTTGLGHFGMPVLVAAFAWVIWTLIHYREAFFTTFRFAPSGIIVQNSRYGVLHMTWDEVAARYSRIGRMIVLTSPKLVRPLAVMNFGPRGALAPEFVEAKARIRGAVGPRWGERWL